MGNQGDSTYFLNDPLELLLSVLPIFIEAADSLATKQTTIDGRSPYLRMQGWCMLVLEELNRTKPLVNSDTECMVKLLDVLEGLLPRHVDLETTIDCPDTGSRRPHQRLEALSSRRTPLKQTSFFQDEKSQSTSSCFDFDGGQGIGDMLHQLQAVHEFCRLHCPEESLIYVDEHTTPKRKRVEPAWAVWKAAQSTYRLLTSVKDCACDPSHPYDARIFLATYRDPQAQENNCNLEIFLSLGSPWQEVRVGVLDQSGVKFLINDKPTTKHVKKTKKIKNLCQLMTQFRKRQLPQRLHRLSFTVEDGSLWNNSTEEAPFPLDLSGGEISLEDFIRTDGKKLTEMTKRIIAVMLGHGVLHLHGTGWMQQSWGASDVIFYQMFSSIPIRPYIQVNLVDSVPECSTDEQDDSDEEDYFGNDNCFMHPFPGLVTLGMILMQVYMAETFDSFAQEFEMEDPEQLDSNAKFALATLVFRKHASAISFSEQYCHAIDRCLDPTIQYDEDGEIRDQDNLRRVIYEEIVGPLEDELGQGRFSTVASNFIVNLDTEARQLDLANWGQPLKSGTPYRSDRGAVSLPIRPNFTMLNDRKQNQNNRADQPIPGKVVDKFRRAGCRRQILDYSSKKMWLCKSSASDFFDDESRQEDIQQQARDGFLSWKEDVLDVYDKFLSSAPGSQPTKVAVLDTGLDLEHPDFIFNLERRQRVKALKDFTGAVQPKGKDRQQILDESGHGTHIAGLLLDLAPDSELYIAKIAEHEPSPNRFIAEAIRHAVDDWTVDLISMSFGFTARGPDYNLVEDALGYANSRNVLLFAAASNSGANQRRTFPARHDYVICVHSTAADGVPSRFNAPREDSNNFATIGEAVESSWPTHLCDKEVNESCIAWKSGTSFATPIAAGIATFLLQYAKENLDAETFKLLRKPQGMRAVFKEIACEKDGYDYIAPKIHPDHLFGRNKEYVRQRMSVVLESS